jgi:hypothetical protein
MRKERRKLSKAEWRMVTTRKPVVKRILRSSTKPRKGDS